MLFASPEAFAARPLDRLVLRVEARREPPGGAVESLGTEAEGSLVLTGPPRLAYEELE